MPVTTSKEDILTVIDLLEAKKMVHIFCRLRDSLPAISDIVAQFANSRDIVGSQDRYRWRAFVISDSFAEAKQVVSGVKRRITVPGFTFWDAAAKGRHGAARALIADPDSLKGIRGNNLLFVLLHNENEDIWNALWPSIADDTQVLAVNSELFSEKGDFAYVDWGE